MDRQKRMEKNKMSDEQKVIEKTAIFPVSGNPPTFGILLSLYSVADFFDKIYVVIENKSYVIKPEMAKKMIELIVCKYSTKFVVIISDTDFKNDTIFDEKLPKFNVILTTSVKIYANLISKGYENVKLISFAKGWDETFHRVAYLRSSLESTINEKLKYVNM